MDSKRLLVSCIQQLRKLRERKPFCVTVEVFGETVEARGWYGRDWSEVTEFRDAFLDYEFGPALDAAVEERLNMYGWRGCRFGNK